MRWGIGAIAGLMLAGCGGGAAGDATGAGPLAEHTIDPETGETRITIPRAEGTATLRAGPRVPVVLPDGLALPDGATIRDHARFERAGGEGILVTFETDVPAADVVARLRDQAVAAGFAVTLENAAGGTLLLIGARPRDGARLAVSAAEGTPTTAQLVFTAFPPG